MLLHSRILSVSALLMGITACEKEVTVDDRDVNETKDLMKQVAGTTIEASPSPVVPIENSPSRFNPEGIRKFLANGGAAVTNSKTVTLELAVEGATHMYITNTSGCMSDGAWENYAPSKSWSLAQTNGKATVFAKFRDAAESESSCVSSSIWHDDVPPSGTSISIENGASTVLTTNVALTLTAMDASDMYVTNMPGCSSGGTWETFAISKSWTLAQDDGTATVFAKFRDSAGNESSCISDSIMRAFHIKGTIVGLADEKSLVLQVNGGDDLVLTTNGAFSFATPKLTGDPYSVTVLTRPSRQLCLIDHGSGTVSASMASITVSCTGSQTKKVGAADASASASVIAKDSLGNIVIAGNTNGSLDGNQRVGTQDFFVTKFDSSGAKLWTRQLGAAGAVTTARSLAVDGTGNIFVTGETDGGIDGNTRTGTLDYFLVKYDSNGTKQWTHQRGIAGNYTMAFGVETDTYGNVFVEGETKGNLDGVTKTGITDSFVTKYDNTGTRQWTRLLGVASRNTFGRGVATDPSGNVVVTGVATGNLDGNTLAGSRALYVTKYNSTGDKRWTKLLGVAGGETLGTGVATDAAGNVFVAGHTTGGLDGNNLTGTRDLTLTKYDSDGIKQWTRQMGVTGAESRGFFVTTDSSGNVYISGVTKGGLDGNIMTGTQDIYFAKFDTQGNKQWVRQIGVPGVDASGGDLVVGDALDSFFVSGSVAADLDGHARIGVLDAFLMKLWQ